MYGSSLVFTLALVCIYLGESASQAPSRSPTTASVGTAFAPTTPGGACLDAEDYGRWTEKVEKSNKLGFDVFPEDLEECAEACAPFLLPPGARPGDYGCSGLGGTCSDLENALCVQDCMGGTGPPTVRSRFPLIQTTPYTAPCASCMGNLSYCGATSCTQFCVQGGSNNIKCRECNEENCNDAFMTCSGLNPTIKTLAGLNFVPILIGAIGGGCAILLAAFVVGAYLRSKSRRNKMLSHEELAMMAGSQQNFSAGASTNGGVVSGALSAMSSGKIENGSMLGPHSSNPVYNKGAASPVSSFGSSVSQLSPYQQQYEAQQRALAQGLIDPRQSRVAPSLRMSQMAHDAQAAPLLIAASAARLVVTFDFVGERDDELSAVVGTRMFGIEQQDGWWLAQTEKGLVGLIPVSYTKIDESTPGPSSSVNPDF